MAYSEPVIDTHHHIWLRKDVAWLADPPTPRMFGDYFGIRRDYSVEEFMSDVKPQGVTKSVHVTAMWGPDRALDETRWLQSVADKHGFPHGIVCNADLSDSGFPICAECAKCCIGTAKLFDRPRPVRISAIRPISAVGSRCWKNTIYISSCRFMQGR